MVAEHRLGSLINHHDHSGLVGHHQCLRQMFQDRQCQRCGAGLCPVLGGLGRIQCLQFRQRTVSSASPASSTCR